MFDTTQKAVYAVYWEGVDCKQDNARNDAHIQCCIRFFFVPAPSTLSGHAATAWLTDWLAGSASCTVVTPSWRCSAALCLRVSPTLNQTAVKKGKKKDLTLKARSTCHRFFFFFFLVIFFCNFYFSWHCSGVLELKPNVGGPVAAHSPIHHLCPCTAVSVSATFQVYSSHYFWNSHA